MVLLIAYASLYIIPVSWFVDVQEIEWQDTCAGSDIIDVHATRTPRWTFGGTSYSELVRFDGDAVYETVYRRGTRSKPKDWTYEKNTYYVEYGTLWNTAINEPGEYAVRSWQVLNPLPLVYRSEYIDESETNRFNVIVCE